MEWGIGYRFNPSDVEIVEYLRRKILGNLSEQENGINELSIYQYDPWDLPDRAKMRSGRSRMWHFFTPCAQKGVKTKRKTATGYWKVTGKDREIKHKGKIIGTKKTLVFHKGRMPKGERTNWIMHEYHDSSDSDYQKVYVVCKVKRKDKKSVAVKPRDGEEASDLTSEVSNPVQTTAESSIDYSRLESLSWNDIFQGHCVGLQYNQGSNLGENVDLGITDEEFVEGLDSYLKDVAKQLLAD